MLRYVSGAVRAIDLHFEKKKESNAKQVCLVNRAIRYLFK